MGWWQRLGGKVLWAGLIVREKVLGLWSGGERFFGFVLKLKRRVCDFHFYLARLTQKNSSPELRVASASTWIQAMSRLIQGLCLKLAAAFWYPQSSRYCEAKLFCKKTRFLFSLQKIASLIGYLPLSFLTVQHWALGGTSAWPIHLSRCLQHLASGEKLHLQWCYSTTGWVHPDSILLSAVGLLHKLVFKCPLLWVGRNRGKAKLIWD